MIMRLFDNFLVHNLIIVKESRQISISDHTVKSTVSKLYDYSLGKHNE